VSDNEIIERIDVFCDAVPRHRARAEDHGPLVLFVPVGSGWPYYARPRLGGREPITPAQVRSVRARQRELVIPESFEWILQAAPDMTLAADDAGLEVRAHPLMVLDADAPAATAAHGATAMHDADAPAGPPNAPDDIEVRLLAPDEPQLDLVWAVPAVAFGHPGTGTGEAGPVERDKLAAEHDGGTIEMLRDRLRSGQSVLAAAFGPDGPLAAGSYQAVDGVAEITGVGVLPATRRKGLGAAVTAALAADALAHGSDIVFLSATDDTVARVYSRLGFRTVGTAMIAEAANHL
jgi:ribosomal protein S18 acetylase RimI-like enzyme